MEIDDKFLLRAEKCAQQNHMIRDLESFNDVDNSGTKGKAFTVRVSNDEIKECAEFGIDKKRKQEEMLMEALIGLMDMEREYDIETGAEPSFLPKKVPIKYDTADIMSFMETLDPLGYDARGDKLPIKVKFLTPNKAKKIKVDECVGKECNEPTDELEELDEEGLDKALEKKDDDNVEGGLDELDEDEHEIVKTEDDVVQEEPVDEVDEVDAVVEEEPVDEVDTVVQEEPIDEVDAVVEEEPVGEEKDEKDDTPTIPNIITQPKTIQNPVGAPVVVAPQSALTANVGEAETVELNQDSRTQANVDGRMQTNVDGRVQTNVDSSVEQRDERKMENVGNVTQTDQRTQNIDSRTMNVTNVQEDKRVEDVEQRVDGIERDLERLDDKESVKQEGVERPVEEVEQPVESVEQPIESVEQPVESPQQPDEQSVEQPIESVEKSGEQPQLEVIQQPSQEQPQTEVIQQPNQEQPQPEVIQQPTQQSSQQPSQELPRDKPLETHTVPPINFTQNIQSQPFAEPKVKNQQIPGVIQQIPQIPQIPTNMDMTITRSEDQGGPSKDALKSKIDEGNKDIEKLRKELSEMKKLTQVNPGELKEKQKQLDEAIINERRMEQGLEELGTKKIKPLQHEIDKLKAANKELEEKIPNIEDKEGEFDDEEFKRKQIEFQERERQIQEREKKQTEEQNQKENQEIKNNNALEHLNMCETDRSKLHEYLGNLNDYLTNLKIDGVKSEDLNKLLTKTDEHDNKNLVGYVEDGIINTAVNNIINPNKENSSDGSVVPNTELQSITTVTNRTPVSPVSANYQDQEALKSEEKNNEDSYSIYNNPLSNRNDDTLLDSGSPSRSHSNQSSSQQTEQQQH